MVVRGALLVMVGLLGGSGAALAGDGGVAGVVLDARTRQPLAGAHVVSGSQLLRADEAGRFVLSADGGAGEVSARAVGYRRRREPLDGGALVLALEPVQPRALYLSAYGIGSAALRGDALRLVAQTELNALVIDAKGDTSVVPWRSAAVAASPLSRQAVVTVPDMPALLDDLHRRGLYLVARVVVFKDQALADARPDWAIRQADGGVWLDGKGQAWVDASNPDTWALSLSLAEEAAALGFDEVQFDYVRFPDTTGVRFSKPNTEAMRTAAISGFLEAARRRLARFNVFVSADVFGYVCWNSNDTHIGQRLELLADRVDYLSPMLYPSGFAAGIPGFRAPVEAPGEVVHRTLREGLRRTGLPGVRWRPWLQAFPDYAFDLRTFGAEEIRAQVRAAEALGTHGWMLWNPHNRYGAAGLAPKPSLP